MTKEPNLGLFFNTLYERACIVLGSLTLDQWWIEIRPFPLGQARLPEVRLMVLHTDRQWLKYNFPPPLIAEYAHDERYRVEVIDRALREFRRAIRGELEV